MTPPDSPIDRTPLREQVHGVVLERITQGTLPPGERLSDAAVAEDLGISRTPVREALLRLEAEGFLESDHMRGFFVPRLAASDAEELYPILWTLESLALELGGPPGGQGLRRLRTLNGRFRGAKDAVARQRADRAFHETLCGHHGNERLDRMLDSLRTSLLRYEIAFMAGGGDPARSARQHDAILDALEGGEQRRARDLLENHWREGLETLRSALG